MTDNQTIIESTVSDACISLFEDYSLPVQRCQADQIDAKADLIYAGVIGFSGDQMRGSLLLATSREPLGRTTPTGDAALWEWIAELSNQLIGRIKNKLIARGVVLHMSTPVVLRGHCIAPLTRMEFVPLVFTCDGGVVCVWFDADLKPGVSLEEVVQESGLMSEGEGMLF